MSCHNKKRILKATISEVILLIGASMLFGFSIAYLHWGKGVPWI